MTGIQRTLYEALMDLARSVQDGKFGQDDDVDAEAFDEDIQDVSDLAN